MATQDRAWHIDKRVPVALILMILMQTFGAAWWASSTDTRVSTLERRMDATTLTMAPQADRLTRVEVKLETVQSGINEIKQLIRDKPMTRDHAE